MLSGAADGDVGPLSSCPRAVLEARRQAIAAGRWRWLRQSHGAGVVVLGPDEQCAGRDGDALVTTVPGAPVAVFAADCALVGLASPQGLAAAVHVGWRSLLAGVIEATATTMRSRGAAEIVAVLGPCIGPECYEFGEGDLEPLEARYGPSVRSRTAQGRPALDLRAGVRRALEALSVTVSADEVHCTACEPGWFSWRARNDTGRHALVVAGDR
ncbi:MAG: polyphenol oxidase family protein [Acidimicrobiales bacterium]